MSFLPRTAGWLRDVILIMLCALFVAILAQIEIPLPFTPVPIMGQAFGVLLVGAALDSKAGAASLASYLALGTVGLPFFAGGAHGIGIITSATGGYLIGFIKAAYVIGLLAELGLERSVRASIIPFLAGIVIIYFCGVAWLAVFLGSFSEAFVAGLSPFLIGDAIKLMVASMALPAPWKMTQIKVERKTIGSSHELKKMPPMLDFWRHRP